MQEFDKSVSRKSLHCHDCGQPFARKAGAGLCCGDDCAVNRTSTHGDIKSQLLALGFEQHDEAPNQFVKNGVSVTVEEVKHVGLDEAILRHGQVSELRNTEGATEGVASSGTEDVTTDRVQGLTD